MLEKTVKAELILENGMKFKGKAFGHIKEVVGEVVFTTAMTGYQETLTDPSFTGQIVCMTYPLIGNYGINLEDMESDGPKLRALIVREKSSEPNNWRCEMELEGFLAQHKILGLEGVDTRALTRVLRENGTMKGIITTRVDDLTQTQIKQKFEVFTNKRAVSEVTIKEKYKLEGGEIHLAVIDFGIKKSMLRELQKRGCRLTVFPAFTSAEEILSENPDGVFLSNGPGDPRHVMEIVETVKKLIKVKPVAGICLGHQIICLALGCESGRLKFGHHGGNHPVKDLKTGRVYITSQNHEFVITELANDVEATYININDKSIEGVRHKTLPVYSVQFHPEASPGPLDTEHILDKMLEVLKNA